MAEMEQRYVNIASFDANDNEVSMLYPTLRVTDDVIFILSMIFLQSIQHTLS